METQPRGAGIFLPITSLPGPYGCGGFGEEARRFIDVLADHHLTAWQILPLTFGATSISPYQSHSSFAKHHLLIDPATLVTEGLIAVSDTIPPETVPHTRVGMTALRWKDQLLMQSYQSFAAGKAAHFRTPFRDFLIEQADWLLDFALYAALFKHFNYLPWQKWPSGLRDRDPKLLVEWELKLHQEVHAELFAQFLLDRQWQGIRSYARGRKIQIIGDLPIYAAMDSVDTWQHREQFLLNAQGHPKRVAGAPPDAFEEHGQTWGMPLYHWKLIEAQGFVWPLRRLQAQFRDFDTLRIDHFLGYARYWAIPHRKKAKAGRWVKGPGNTLFDAIKKVIPPEKFIMEDLGVGSHTTARILRRFGAPGMRVLCMELDYVRKMSDAVTYKHPTVAYTSTHDTDTLIGVYGGLSAATKEKIRLWWQRQTVEELPLPLRFIAPLLATTASLVIIPLQDLMGWGSGSRINRPGTDDHLNWSWRFAWDDLNQEHFQLLDELLVKHQRARRSPHRSG